jgi:hypothetical protein
MADRALRTLCGRMYLPRFDLSLVVAMKAEGRRFRNEEKGFPRAVGVVTYTASTRGYGPVNMLLMNIQVVAIQTQLFHRQDQLVAAGLLMTRFTHFRGIWPMGTIGNGLLRPVLRSGPVVRDSRPIVGHGHPIEEKAEGPIPGFRRTSGRDKRCQDTSDE